MITSSKNPLIKRIVSLRDKKDRLKQGVFLIEGKKEIQCAVAAGVSIETLICCPDLAENIPETHAELIEVSQPVYAKIAYRQKVQGLIAIAAVPDNNIATLKLPGDALVLVVYGIEKPGNLGAILRTADGAGADAVIVVSDEGTDLYNPNVVRASLGAIFTVKVFEITYQQATDWLKDNDIKVVLTSPDAATNYTEIDYTTPTAIVLGSEKQGLPRRWLKTDVTKVKIPMVGQTDSLNVSCSAAILLYEALRQRWHSHFPC